MALLWCHSSCYQLGLKGVIGVGWWGLKIMSLTFVATSGIREPITWSSLVFWKVILQVLNYASIWANYTSGSVGQKAGILMFTAVTAGIEDDGCFSCCGGFCYCSSAMAFSWQSPTWYFNWILSQIMNWISLSQSAYIDTLIDWVCGCWCYKIM